VSHRQIPTTHPQTGEIIPIDGRLSKLIAALWESGVNTYCSCQSLDKTGFGYITLATSKTRKARFHSDCKKAVRLLQELVAATGLDLWFDLGPTTAILRFKTKDIGTLTDVILIGTAENPIKVRGDGIHRAQLTEGAHYYSPPGME